MYIFLSILIVLACLLLIGAVLIQKSKGGGLASDYSQGNQYLGYRKTTDFIEKATWSLAIFICVVSICASFAIKIPVNVSSMAPAPAATSAPAPAPSTTSAPQEAASATQDATPAASETPAGN